MVRAEPGAQGKRNVVPVKPALRRLDTTLSEIHNAPSGSRHDTSQSARSARSVRFNADSIHEPKTAGSGLGAAIRRRDSAEHLHLHIHATQPAPPAQASIPSEPTHLPLLTKPSTSTQSHHNSTNPSLIWGTHHPSSARHPSPTPHPSTFPPPLSSYTTLPDPTHSSLNPSRNPTANLPPYTPPPPPPAAPRLPGGIYADVDYWTGKGPEDVLSPSAIKEGFTLESPRHGLGSASKGLWPILKTEEGVGVLNEFFSRVVQIRERKAREGLVQRKTQIPARVTLTESKRDAWLRELGGEREGAAGAVGKIPRGVSTKMILDQCVAKRIPLERAVALLVASRGLEMQELRRVVKGVSSAGEGIREAQWSENWTDHCFRTLKSAIDSCTDWEKSGDLKYCLRLIGLLTEKDTMLVERLMQQILRETNSAKLSPALNLWAVVIRQFWTSFIGHDKAAAALSRVAHRLAEHRLFAEISTDLWRDAALPFEIQITSLLDSWKGTDLDRQRMVDGAELLLSQERRDPTDLTALLHWATSRTSSTFSRVDLLLTLALKMHESTRKPLLVLPFFPWLSDVTGQDGWEGKLDWKAMRMLFSRASQEHLLIGPHFLEWLTTRGGLPYGPSPLREILLCIDFLDYPTSWRDSVLTRSGWKHPEPSSEDVSEEEMSSE